MAASESVRFDIIGNDKASDAFSRVGRSASEMSTKMDAAAYKSAMLDDALKRQRETSRRTADAALSLAKSDAILDEAERRLRDGALETEFALKKEEAALKGVRREADRLDGKKVRVKVEVDRSVWNRIGTSLIGGGRGTGILGRIGNLVPGLAGTGGGASGLGALASAGSSWFTNPYVLGAIAAASPFAAQGVAGAGIFGLGFGLAGLGIAGAFGTGKTVTAAQLTAAQDALRAAQLREAAAQAAASKKPGAAAQATLASAQGSVVTAQARLAQLQDSAQTPLQAQMRASFKTLSGDAQDSLAKIGKSFVPVMQSVFNTADSVLKKMTPLFAGAERAIAGPFRIFADTLLNAFNQPAVRTSITAVAGAFGKLLTALTPQLAGDVAQVADGITRIARSVAEHPQAFADFIKGFFKLAGIALDGISALANFGGYLQQHFWPAMHRTAVIFDGVRHEIAHIASDMASALIRTYNALWNTIIGSTIRFGHNVETQWNSVTHEIAVIFDGMRGQLGRIYSSFWNDTIGATIRFGHNIETQWNSITGSIVGFFRRLPGQAVSALSSLGGDLLKIGSWALGQLWAGLKSAAGAVTGGGIIGWLAGFAKGIVGVFKKIWGWFSPSSVMYQGGKSLMQGLANGIKDHAHLAQKQAASVASAVSGLPLGPPGPLSANAAVAQAFARSILFAYGWRQDQFPALQALWNQESGWNSYAVNPSSGAYGIPQSLGHGHPYNLGDYQAQIRWGLAYISSVYGSPAAAWQHEMAFNWYDRGGWLMPGVTLAYNATGRPERVLPPGGGGDTHVHVTVNVPPTVNPREAGRQVAELLLAHTQSGGRLYPAGRTPR